jgi:hypothetical protein
MVEVGGGVVCSYRIKDVVYQRDGASGSRSQKWLFGLMQGEGIIWRCGGVDGRPGEGLRLFLCSLEMAWWECRGGDF